MTSSNQGSPIEIAAVVYLTVLGLAVRLAAPIMSQFPLNDGGLFHVMIVDLVSNGLRLPFTITYNNADIPFVYPPLAIYFTAILEKMTGLATLDLLRILPAVFSGLAVPAFYLLARELTSTKLQTVFAVFSFAFIPRVFEWHVTGGGITRAPGFIFAMVTLYFVQRSYKKPTGKNLSLSALFGAITLLTHPEAAVHTAISAGVFYLWMNRSIKGMMHSLAVALGVIALSAPWWLFVILRHGFDPFQAALSAVGADSPNILVRIFVGFLFIFTDEPYLAVTAVFALIGLFASIARRDFFPIVWMFALYLLEPRGGALYMMLPLSLLAGLGLVSIFSNLVRGPSAPVDISISIQQVLEHKTARWMFAFLFVYLLMAAFATGERLRKDFSLQSSDVETFFWISNNTPPSASFAVLTGESTPFRDPWTEWFPAITERKSLGTIFGYEWVDDGMFEKRILRFESLQACARKDADCLSVWEDEYNLDLTHLYLQLEDATLPLQISLKNSRNYKLIYETNTAAIYEQLK